MLNPIDTEAVIRDGRIAGVFPGEIHEGVAWWAGACHVVVSRARQMAVAHDGHPTTAASTGACAAEPPMPSTTPAWSPTSARPAKTSSTAQ
ncbi:hypothetical protein OG949_21680 [Streptomyces scopuliridis]|uniref:hypothetical protein n=1 Tax=Streptomyces scopuliridis TaxID=452529 RepID=UPI002DDAE13C|nr:hypothetical protein [Streptomyces scopuliridis]WSB35205.1 hypothetical protein OG949_21680 [Streptomyces scopuliridis]